MSNKLGFGMMRLPKKGLVTDIEQTKKMVDLFLEAGFTYFDTAFVYLGSEDATRKALVERYPRESFTIATKVNVSVAISESAAKKQFETSMTRLGVDYVDYYLLHAMSANNYKKYEKYNIWDFVLEQKELGKIKHVGFSFHDSPELLDKLLIEHPYVDFVQLQLNYADWENESIQSRANYEVARKHGKDIVVMEPVKGGALANPPEEAAKLLKAHNPDASLASWAIRFVASLDGVLTVLSGMSDVAQMEDNLSYMRDFRPLDESEQEVIRQAQIILGNDKSIKCTSCHYCTEGCPKQIPIPEVFTAMNKRIVNGRIDESKAEYESVTEGRGKASECIKCRKCEGVCPQHIEICNNLDEIANAMGV